MAAKGRAQPRVRAAARALPVGAAGVGWSRLLPSRGSLLVGLALVAAAGCAYLFARETRVFAVERIEVSGAPPAVAADVRAALRPVLGRSLVGLDGAGLERRVEALPTVFAVSYDRAFPHTLRVIVHVERAAAVLRRGSSAWLVSARGRVIRPLRPDDQPGLPRIWVPESVGVARGDVLALARGGAAARVLGLLAADGFPARVASSTAVRGELSLQLRSGVVVRLGAPVDLELKLAVARRLVPRLAAGDRYLDVSVPGRPVAGTNVKVSG